MDELTVGVIGGTGLGEGLGLGGDVEHVRLHDGVETPFGSPSGPVLEARWEGVRVLLLARHGPGHVLPPSGIPYRANVYALKQLGASAVLASGAVGSLREEIRPTHLCVADQVIDKTHRRAGTFFDRAAVHVELAEPFCPVLRKVVLESAGAMPAITTHARGTYVCMEGPAFSTRAESLMHRLWGADLIGMTVMPEARLAREAELPYALVALVTDYDCWKAPAGGHGGDALLAEIRENLRVGTENAMGVLRGALRLLAASPGVLEGSAARTALKMGIWSDKGKIDPDEVARLRVLWGRYFSHV